MTTSAFVGMKIQVKRRGRWQNGWITDVTPIMAKVARGERLFLGDETWKPRGKK